MKGRKKLKSKNKICPRCKELITGYPALSRKDNKTEICSSCGTLEALEIFYNSEFLKNERDRK